MSLSMTRRWPDYRTVWRWHFYAGLFCIPFVIWLATTGSIYLFKPQVEAWLDRPYEGLAVTGSPATPSRQVSAALAAVPGSVLNAYELPQTPASAVRVLVGRGDQLMRVYLQPETAQVLNIVNEDERLMKTISRLHGELMWGSRGSMLVEMAASWAVVMLISGLYLWWPRGAAGVAGVVYPRLNRGGRVFWRDLHAVTGLWVSFFALFLLLSGLPWAKSWGSMLKSARQLGSTMTVKQDWTTGTESELAERRLANAAPAEEGEHAHHHQEGMAMGAVLPAGQAYDALDKLVPTVSALSLMPPVLISPPSAKAATWSARSDTPNRPQRVTLALDGDSGAVISRKSFAQQPVIDRIVGVGVAAHEGQLFGWFNQALGLFTALSLLTVSISAIVMWWRRREAGVLGAPGAMVRVPLARGIFVLLILLGILLPLLGLSMIAVLLLEKLVLSRLPATSRFLGLKGTSASGRAR
jgi:uncharacterized iron-regulated membrane protein